MFLIFTVCFIQWQGFDVKLIDVNRTCKVTKGGQLVKYTVMVVACGNYHGVIGFAKAKGPAVPTACQKVYLWPGPTQGGMKAGRTVQTILNLAGFKNVKSKVVGSRNPHNTVKALFKGLMQLKRPKTCKRSSGVSLWSRICYDEMILFSFLISQFVGCHMMWTMKKHQLENIYKINNGDILLVDITF
ncbi:putative ribosomal protein S5 [Helianthus annuus]|nr:putative ribosomal protein S5 [Helianthus annuus]